MNGLSGQYVVGDTIGEAAWTKAALGARSGELTALYVVRQRARFLNRIATYHDHWEITAVRSGTGTLTGPTGDLREHTICLIPPGVPHQEASDQVMDLIWLGIQGSRLLGIDCSAVATVVSCEISELMERMWLFAQMTPGGIGPELDAMAALVVAKFLRMRAGESTSSTDRVERAILLFHEKMAEPLSMVEVARKLGCSASCFTREFRRRTGQTPIAYLTGIRIRHATRLLETTDLTVREIADLTGYSEAFYFSRVFTRLVGRSPSLWRSDRLRIRR